MIEILTRLRSGQKSAIIILFDFMTILISVYLSFALRFGVVSLGEIKEIDFFQVIPLIVFIQMIVFWKMSLYKGIWRFSSTPDLVRIIKAVSLSCVLVSFILFVTVRLENIPRSVFFIDWLLLIVGLGGGRFSYRILADHKNYRIAKNGEPVLIIGAGVSGNLLFKDMQNNFDLKYNIVGFVDDNTNLKGKYLQNTPVLGTTGELSRIIKETGATKLFIAIPSASSEEIAKIVERGNGLSVSFKILPKMSDLIHGRSQLSQLRNIRIEDLLGRESIKLDTNEINKMLHEKVVFITGAGGSIGSELCNQVARFNPNKLICLDSSEFNLYSLEKEIKLKYPDLQFISLVGDVRNSTRLEKIIKNYKPQIILHAAAYKHVPIMEANPYESVQTNVTGTENVSRIAGMCGVEKFVLVSTDKAVNPTNIMGATKRIAEIVCKRNSEIYKNTKYVIVRFGNVLGSSGSVIPHFQSQIESGGPVTVTHEEITRYFMSIPEASQLVLEAASLGSGGEIFLLDMGKPVRISDLAKQMIRLSGLEPGRDIEITYTGLRPGEKLYEELLANDETTLKTIHPKVHIAKSRNQEQGIFDSILELQVMDSESSLEKYKVAIKKIVPEYTTPEQHYLDNLQQIH